MTTKRDALARLALCEGPFYSGHQEEPVFTLRARDKFFVPLVRMWIELVETDVASPPSDALCRKLMDAVELANRGVDWQNAHPERVKVPG